MKKIAIQFLLGFFTIISVYATSDTYTLADITYDIKGTTKPFFLEHRLNISRDITFESLAEIDEFKDKLKQDLENLRVFENYDVTYKIEDKNVFIHIYLDDAWGIVPFGFPKYNSEEGGRIALKLFWYNSLGTLTNSKLQGGINIKPKLDNSEELEINEWDASLTVEEILLFDKYFDISYTQALERDSIDESYWSFHSSDISISTNFNFIFGLKYSPKLSMTAQYNYKPVAETIEKSDIPQKPLTITYSHSVGDSNINWYGNFREGFGYGISNSIHLLNVGTEDIKPSTDFSLTGSYYKTFGSLPISLATRATGKFSINDRMTGLGNYVRGVESGNLYGNLAFFSNNNAFIRVIKIPHIAEAIFGPHIDFGVTDIKGLRYGTGGDFILYIDKLKSMVARGSISIDLTDFDPDSFELGDLQIDITSSLFF
ncbi:MAG: hypothetical protein JXR64_06720 [Spirochaetales bacterium]|nr:hypothetical protein [Spirochaetales bacterium]